MGFMYKPEQDPRVVGAYACICTIKVKSLEEMRSTHSCAFGLCQSCGVASDQFVLVVLPAGAVNTETQEISNLLSLV